MNLLIESAIKIALLLGLALAASLVLSHRSAAMRHWVLATAIIAALALPALMVLVPSWRLPVRAESRTEVTPRRSGRVDTQAAVIGVHTAVVNAHADAPQARAIEVAPIVLTVWLAGLAITLAGLIVGLWRLSRISAKARPVDAGPWHLAARRVSEQYGLRTPVRLLQSDEPALLVTWGFFTPTVMLPLDAESWADDRIHVVLAHELAHVSRSDWAVQIAGELLRAMYWFNPVVWLACSRLRQESERACDDAVVNLGVEGQDYAAHLLDLARQFGRSRQLSFPAVAIAPRPSNLQRRVSAMLNTRLSRRPVSALARFATIGALLAVALPLALFAQNAFSTLSGSVVDESGALLPGVIVVAIDKQRGAQHQVRTDGGGSFELLGLAQGDYTLEATLPGFETVRRTLTLNGENVSRNLTMQLGSLQETIVVTNTPNEPSNRPAAPRGPYNRPACTPSTPSASTASAGIRRIGGQIRVPVKLRHVSPIYPAGAGAGIVRMNTVIGTDGFVKEVTVTNTAAPELARAAEDAVRQWQFDQTLLNCMPVDVRMSVLVEFR